MKINITHPMIYWDKESRTFSCELSDIEKTRFEITNLCHRKLPITTYNPKTGNTVLLTWKKTDMDSTHEDTYGWWYKGVFEDKEFEFLFIND